MSSNRAVVTDCEAAQQGVTYILGLVYEWNDKISKAA